MVSNAIRRPLPALVALVALLLLTGLVWWRVLHRGTSSDAADGPCPTPSATAQATLPAPSKVTATVLNATSRNGIATATRRTLIDAGFQVPKLAANAPKKTKVSATAQLRYGPKAKAGATLLRYYFPGATLVATNSTSDVVYVLLGNKYKRVASSASVKQALAGDKVAIASTSPSPAASSTATC